MAEVEILDAYQEHVRARREREEVPKICRLVLPQEELAAIWRVVAAAVDAEGENLSKASKDRWESTLRTIARSVQEAE